MQQTPSGGVSTREGIESPTLKTRCRRCEARYGLRGVRVGEVLHPGPARPVRRSARLRAQEVSSTAVDTPSPTHSTLLDALEFDLTIADSTESESGGHEPRVPELPAISFPRLSSQTVAVHSSEFGQVDSQCWMDQKTIHPQ